ncbi:hypothetical protein ABK040_000616 [Willaertia magna]
MSKSSSSSSSQPPSKEKLHDILGKALTIFNQIYEPFLKKCLIEKFGENQWELVIEQSQHRMDSEFHSFSSNVSSNANSNNNSSTLKTLKNKPQILNFDTQNIIQIILRFWNELFSSSQRNLTNSEKHLLFELRICRNIWAHQHYITLRDTYRYLDTIQRLIDIFPDKKQEIEKIEKLRNTVLFYLANQVKEEEKKKKDGGILGIKEEIIKEEHNQSSTIQQHSFHNNMPIMHGNNMPVHNNMPHTIGNINNNNNMNHHQSMNGNNNTMMFNERQEELIYYFMQTTNLTREYAIMCLLEAKWDPPTAMQLFNNAAHKLPQNAFIQSNLLQ